MSAIIVVCGRCGAELAYGEDVEGLEGAGEHFDRCTILLAQDQSSKETGR